jgi:hypothetical protein
MAKINKALISKIYKEFLKAKIKDLIKWANGKEAQNKKYEWPKKYMNMCSLLTSNQQNPN